jgi:short-subunit dehydrogenase
MSDVPAARGRGKLPPPDPNATCLVTGASSGIGTEIARALAKRGHGIALVARRKERLEELADELRTSHGVRVEALACDVSRQDERERMLAELEELGLTVEVLVNNAGVGTSGRFHELDTAQELEMMRLNCEAVVALCGAFVPGMVERGRGALLNVASTAAFQPLPTEATYAATKAFVLSFTEALHGDLAKTGVVATALCPGPVKTEFMEGPGIEEAAATLPSFMWVDAEVVAEQGVKALERGLRIAVPGVANRVGANLGRHTHRGLLLAVARQVVARR